MEMNGRSRGGRSGDESVEPAAAAPSRPTEAYVDDVVGTTPPVERTAAYTDEETQRGGGPGRHGIGAGARLDLPGGPFRVERAISGEGRTGEAAVYLLRDHRDRPFALKLYYEFADPNLEPNPEALSRIAKIDDPDILRLHAYGTGDTKYRGRFCFEISDYAAGGTLLDVADLRAKYDPSFVREHVVQEIFKGIVLLHGHGIFHCDLKPQNIFYLDEEQTDLVIGDYGSAKTYDQIEFKGVSHTSVVKGSREYLAPEQARGLVSEKNDYYSLGMVLVRLLYPEMMTREGLSRIYERQFSRKPILDFRPEFGDLNVLIAGLTLEDSQARWGRSEVERWLAGSPIDVHYGAETEPIKLGSAGTIRAPRDLIEFLEGRSDWYETLFADEDTFSLLRMWVARIRDVEQKNIFARLVRACQQEGEEFVKEAVLRFFEPERAVTIESAAYDLWAAPSLSAEVGKAIDHLDRLWKSAPERELRLYVFRLELALNHVAAEIGDLQAAAAMALVEKISAALGQGPRPDGDRFATRWHLELKREQILELAWAFDPERGFRDREGVRHRTIEDLGLYLAREPAAYADSELQVERERFLQKVGWTQKAGSYEGFLFAVFRGEIRSRARLTDLQRDQNGYNLSLAVGQSLQEFFKRRGVEQAGAAWRVKSKENVVVPRVPLRARYSARRMANHLAARAIDTLAERLQIAREAFDETGVRELRAAIAAGVKRETGARSRRALATASLVLAIMAGAGYFLGPVRAAAVDRLDRAAAATAQESWLETVDLVADWDPVWSVFPSLASRARELYAEAGQRHLGTLLEEKRWVEANAFLARPAPGGVSVQAMQAAMCAAVVGGLPIKDVDRDLAPIVHAVRDVILGRGYWTPAEIQWLDEVVSTVGGPVQIVGQWRQEWSSSRRKALDVRLRSVRFTPPNTVTFDLSYSAHLGLNIDEPTLQLNGQRIAPVSTVSARDRRFKSGESREISVSYRMRLESLLTSKIQLSGGMRNVRRDADRYSTIQVRAYQAAAQQPFAPTHRCAATTSVNVRSGPATSYPVIGAVRSGESVQMLGRISEVEEPGGMRFYRFRTRAGYVGWAWAGSGGTLFRPLAG